VNIVAQEDPLLLVPGPSSLIPRARRALTRHIGHRSPDFRTIFRKTTELLREVFDTSGDVHILTASGTGAVEAAVMNFIRSGDRVLSIVYGTFGRRFMEQAARVTDNIYVLKTSYGDVPSVSYVRKFLEENKVRELDIVTVVFNETNPGTRFRELSDLAKLAHSYGAILIVDAVSGLGGDYFSCEKNHIDVALSSSQKCLGAPPGLSFITYRTVEAERKLRQVRCPSTYFDLKTSKRFLERNETPFTPAVNVLYALKEALEYICDEVGLDRWIRWHHERARVILDALQEIGLKPYVKDEPKRSVTVLSFEKPENTTVSELKSELYMKYRIDIADGMDELKGKIFRIGNMGWLTRKDITLLITALINTLMRKTTIKNIEKALQKIHEAPLLY